MKLSSRDVSLSATVGLLDFARSIDLDFSYETMCKITDQLERMCFVDEVEDRHQFWIKLELDTGNALVAERRIKATLIKVERLLRRYAKGTAA